MPASASFTVTRIPDIDALPLPPARAFPSLDAATLREHAARLGQRFVDPVSLELSLSFHSWLIRPAAGASGPTILVDTCIGDDKERPNRPAWHRRREGAFLARLAAAGVQPEDVDIVLCTHLHADHVGWNTRLVADPARPGAHKWVPTFPRARYLMAETEYRNLRDKTAALGAAANHDCFPDSVLPVVEAGQAEMVSMSHHVAPGIQLEPAPGHTPGSVLIHLAGVSAGKGASAAVVDAICTGDLIHHPIQLAMPSMLTAYCEDPHASARQRVALCEGVADTGTRVLTAHFPAPSMGCICADGPGRFRFAFDEADPATSTERIA